MFLRSLIQAAMISTGLFAWSIVVSQEGSSEKVAAYFRIMHGFKNGDTIFPIIRGGSNHGIKEGMPAYAFSKSYNNFNGENTRRFSNIGYGKVVRVFPDSSVCLINLAKTGNKSDSVLLEDAIMITIDKPVKKYPNIYLDLALRNIFFRGMNNEMFYTLDISLKNDLKKLDSVTTAFFVKELHDAYNLYKNKSSLPKYLFEPVGSGGRFLGKIPFEVMKNATAVDVHDFFRYVLAYPGGYVSQNSRFAESFLGWVSYPGNFTADDIYRDLFPIYKDRGRLNAEIPRYRSSLVDENMLFAYSDSIKHYHNKKLYGKVDTCREFAWAITDAVKDTAAKANIMLAMAVNKFVDGEHRRSIVYCDSAVYYARQSRAYKTEMEANLQKSEVLFGMNKGADAKQVFTEMQSRIKLYGSAMNEEDRNFYKQRGFQYSGWFDYKNGEYGKALQNFAIALHLNNIDRSFSSRRNNALIYKYMGFIYKEQGKTDEALKSFSASELLYDSVGDPKEKAYIWNEVGVVYYNAGKYSEAVNWFERAGELSKELGLYDNLGYSISMKANCLWNFNKIDSAILLHREAINTRRDINPLGVAYSWDQLGQLFQVNAYKTFALDAFDSSRAIYEQRRDSSRIQENYINVGLVYHNDENYKKAISYFEKALRSSSKNSSTALFDLGLAWSELDRTKSVSYLKMAERGCDSSKDLVLQYKVLYNLTNIHYRSSDYVKGDISLRKMENLLKEIGTPVRLAMTHALKGVRYECKSMLDSALFEYEKALVIYDTISKLDAVNMLASKSNIYISKGDFDESLRVIDLALKYSQDAGSPIGKSMSYGRFGFIYGELGEFDKGLIAIDSALAIYKSSGNNIRYASTLVTRGMLLKDKGEFRKALGDILYADSVYLAEGVETYRGGSLNDAATVYMSQGDYSRAIEYLRASEQYSLGEDRGEGYMINRINLSECYYNQKKYKEALDILNSNYPETVRRKFNRVAMGMANILGNIYFELGDLAKARIFKRQAFDLSVKSGSAEEMINAMVYLGKIDLQELKTDSAETKIRRSLLLGKERGLTGSLWEAFYELGIVFYTQKRYDSAIVYFRSAVDIVEQLAGNIYGGEEARKLYSSDPRKVDLYNKIIASFVAVKDPAKASEYALRNSITALNSKYGKDLGFADSTLKADLAKAEDIQRQIRAVNANIAKADTKEKKEALIQTRRILEEGYQNFMDERKEKYRDFDKYLKGGVNPEDLSNYKGGLPDDMAVISYIINDSLLYKFVVTNSTLEIVTTSLSEDINVQVNEFISALTSPDSGSGTGSLKVRADFADKKKTSKKSFTEVSEKLYDILVADLLPVIGDKKKLCIIPSGKLSNIPFQCLGKKGADGFRFLLEDYRVFYANRLDMFRSKDASDRNISNMAAFGNPDKSLEFAKLEVLNIQKISQAKMVYVEEGATEVKAKESLVQHKYVHFATHGTLDYVKPKQSYLTFTASPGVGDDGRLTIAEIDSMKTGSQYAELVTLSACETARPLAISEDWYVSPANSFLRKKFKTVVASLWKVNDEATGVLMSEFYRNLEKMEKVDALRQAQETVSGDPRYKHPYYWGGFVLYGDWR